MSIKIEGSRFNIFDRCVFFKVIYLCASIEQGISMLKVELQRFNSRDIDIDILYLTITILDSILHLGWTATVSSSFHLTTDRRTHDLNTVIAERNTMV